MVKGKIWDRLDFQNKKNGMIIPTSHAKPIFVKTNLTKG